MNDIFYNLLNLLWDKEKFYYRPICLPDPIKDLKHESGPFTFAGFGLTNDFFSNYEELTGLKVPYIEILKEEDVKDLFLAEKVILICKKKIGKKWQIVKFKLF